MMSRFESGELGVSNVSMAGMKELVVKVSQIFR